jgi:hypothetical protein
VRPSLRLRCVAIFPLESSSGGKRRFQFPRWQHDQSRGAGFAASGRDTGRHPCMGTSQEPGTATTRGTLRPRRTAPTSCGQRRVASTSHRQWRMTHAAHWASSIRAHRPGALASSPTPHSNVSTGISCGATTSSSCACGPTDAVERRLDARRPLRLRPSLLDSQVASLESLGADENAIEVDLTRQSDEMAAEVIDRLELTAKLVWVPIS